VEAIAPLLILVGTQHLLHLRIEFVVLGLELRAHCRLDCRERIVAILIDLADLLRLVIAKRQLDTQAINQVSHRRVWIKPSHRRGGKWWMPQP
jgi:hypothetical protein